MSSVVVLVPSCTFREVAVAFERAGWRGGPITALAPLVAGEPELAVWRKDDQRAQYECNPVTWLRTVRTAAGVELPPLPTMSRAFIERLAHADAAESRLLARMSLAALDEVERRG